MDRFEPSDEFDRFRDCRLAAVHGLSSVPGEALNASQVVPQA